MSRRPATKALSIVGETIGAYKTQREIARGGMGVVYEAVHQTIGHRAAIKVLSAELAKDPEYEKHVGRLIDEARAVNVIDDPGVVRVFDLGTLPGGTVYIMMEYLEGQSLYRRQQDIQKKTGGRMPLEAVLRFTRQIAGTVAAAHDKRILHRDLKPENVIIVADREVPGAERTKVVDFGIARFMDAAQRRTAAGIVLGTALYISPEQCSGVGEVDGRADVYSLGVMLYEMLAGNPPFLGEPTAIMMAHINDPPPSLQKLLPSLPQSVQELVDDMMAKDPARRLTMKDVVERIRKIEEGGKDLVPGAFSATMHQPAVERQPVRPRALPGMAVIAGACGIAIGLLLVLGWTAISSGRTKPPPALTPAPVAVHAPAALAPPPRAPLPPAPVISGTEASIKKPARHHRHHE